MTKYWLFGGGGAMLLGSGLAVLLHGSKLRENNTDPWFWISTGGFALIMSGRTDFYDLNKRGDIFFVIISVFPNAGENTQY